MPSAILQLLWLLTLAYVAQQTAAHSKTHRFRLHIDKQSMDIIKSAQEDYLRYTAEAKTLDADREQLAESRDEDFWASQWQKLEKDAMQLEQGLILPRSGLLQIGKQPALDKIKGQVQGLMGKAALAPMLGMLKSMYQDQKKRIGDLNKKEEISKKRFAKQEAQFHQRVKDLEDKAKLHKLDEAFVKNGTAEYTRQFTYWQHVRERNHRQFHNTLKITHGMMQREKDMISQYEKALAMPDPHAHAPESKPAKPEEAPEVVLEQQRVEFRNFVRDALVEIRHEISPASKRSRRRSRPMRNEMRLV